ncbi:MAG: M1 family metallopeptidase [Saprospiraceae bacterium]|nr:M1 family metallopeptidase [Saprospiraceae bacterium]
MKYNFLVVLLLSVFSLNGQSGYWQQKADYKMTIDFDSKKHRFKGEQTITYTNNSPDELDKLFYHLYFNAFQPGSMMDTRSRTIRDPDGRVGDRISKLTKEEIGYQKIKSLKIDGKKVKYKVVGTILEVDLDKHTIQPGQTVKLSMKFEAQVPIQIRRSGRDNAEGIDYSMAQWYPKLSEYDHQGWHANPYVGREFHGIWGDFDVTIKMDKKYTIGATGVLQNPERIGKGYSDVVVPNKNKKLEWNFIAENVHDFVWSADPDYEHITHKAYDGTILHFLYQPNERTTNNWKNLPRVMDVALKYLNERFGKYPYPVYSFLQGGDGGMEYPMATLITGERSFPSLVGVSVHEWMHSWFQMVLGTNESLYPWMDEGFTSFGTAETMNYLRKQNLLHGGSVDNPMARTINGFSSNHAGSPLDEPISTHADHFRTNRAYGVGSYTKGAIYLEQLQYIMGKEAFAQAMLNYYNQWKFKHPTPNDLIRIMEKESGLELDWYNEYMVNTTKYPDYSIDTVYGKTLVLSQRGEMPMPLEIVLTTVKDEKEVYYIPMRIMRGEKPNIWPKDVDYNLMEDWPWTHPEYILELNCKLDKIKKIEINPTINFVDLDRKNNVWPREERE